MSRSLLRRSVASSLPSCAKAGRLLATTGFCFAIFASSSSSFSSPLAIVVDSGLDSSAYASALDRYHGPYNWAVEDWGWGSAYAGGTTLEWIGDDDPSDIPWWIFDDVIEVVNIASANADADITFPGYGYGFGNDGFEEYAVYASASTSIQNNAWASASASAYLDIEILEDVFFTYSGPAWAYGNSGILPAGFYSLSVSASASDEGWDSASQSLIIWAIPEPASLSILALGGLALLRRRAS